MVPGLGSEGGAGTGFSGKTSFFEESGSLLPPLESGTDGAFGGASFNAFPNAVFATNRTPMPVIRSQPDFVEHGGDLAEEFIIYWG